jgi:hypothetical protein
VNGAYLLTSVNEYVQSIADYIGGFIYTDVVQEDNLLEASVQLFVCATYKFAD